MRIKKGFELRNVCGENIIVASGKENIDFSKIISLNETAAYLWNAVQGKDFEAADLAGALTAEYEVTDDVALSDSELIMKQWHEAGLIE